MAYKVKMLDQAKIDLRDILDYKAGFYPGTAVRFLDEFEEKYNNLLDNPNMYGEYQHNTIYHRVVMNDYNIFFRIIQTLEEVEIYRILHSSMDVKKYL